jgi:transcriptional regulator with XRE-family HTH domain
MNDLAQKIGHAIRNCRIEQKITQEKLALLCNIDRSYVGRIERGEVNITVLKFYEIAQILKVAPHDLICCLKTNEASSYFLIYYYFYNYLS